MNPTAVVAPSTVTPSTVAPTTSELATSLQDMVRRLLLDAPSVQAAAQPLCLCWIETRD